MRWEKNTKASTLQIKFLVVALFLLFFRNDGLVRAVHGNNGCQFPRGMSKQQKGGPKALSKEAPWAGLDDGRVLGLAQNLEHVIVPNKVGAGRSNTRIKQPVWGRV